MPIDTSSYYPEVPRPEGEDDSFSLNRRDTGLFGSPSPAPSPEEPERKEPAPHKEQESRPRSKDDGEYQGEKVVTVISNILSWVFVPLLMPVYGLILSFSLSVLDVAPMGMRVIFTLIVAGINFVVPMIMVVLLKKMGLVDDFGLNGRIERLIPYIMTVVCFGGTAWFMAAKGAPSWLSLFFAGGAVAALVNMIINFKWKISSHAAGIAGIVALLICIEKDGFARPELFGWLIASIIVSGLLGSARVWLGRHTVWQVLAGYAVGFCSVFFLTMC